MTRHAHTRTHHGRCAPSKPTTCLCHVVNYATVLVGHAPVLPAYLLGVGWHPQQQHDSSPACHGRLAPPAPPATSLQLTRNWPALGLQLACNRRTPNSPPSSSRTADAKPTGPPPPPRPPARPSLPPPPRPPPRPRPPSSCLPQSSGSCAPTARSSRWSSPWRPRPSRSVLALQSCWSP